MKKYEVSNDGLENMTDTGNLQIVQSCNIFFRKTNKNIPETENLKIG